MKAETAELLIGQASMAAVVAASYGLRPVRVASSTARHHFVGHGRPKNPKRAVLERCRVLGWDVPGHDAADACAVWAWAKATHDRSFRLEAATPLFGKAHAVEGAA